LRFASLPFQLGVASGDPAADGFVIWTRLAPEPFDTGYLGQTIFEVAWEVAEDASFTRIAKQGTAWARPHLAHSLRAEIALYIVHGILHTTGFDDVRARDRARMRAAERAVMQRMRLHVHAVDA
jgi:alkaline phosphatase D